MSNGGNVDWGEVGSLGDELSKEVFRGEFAENADAATRGKGLHPEKMGRVYQTLKKLSKDQLDGLVEVRNSLNDPQAPAPASVFPRIV